MEEDREGGGEFAHIIARKTLLFPEILYPCTQNTCPLYLLPSLIGDYWFLAHYDSGIAGAQKNNNKLKTEYYNENISLA